MITLTKQDIDKAIFDGQSKRSSKHNVAVDGDNLIIASSAFSDSISIPMSVIKSVNGDRFRDMIRGLTRNPKATKKAYYSSLQNVADKIAELKKAI